VAQRTKNRAVNLDKKQGMQPRRFNAPSNARPDVDLPDCAAHYNYMAFYFSLGQLRRRFCGGQSISYLDPMFAKWVMARSTEVWPRGIRPHDLDGVFGHYRPSRSRLYAENLVKQ
jgi:hypothetical protein